MQGVAWCHKRQGSNESTLSKNKHDFTHEEATTMSLLINDSVEMEAMQIHLLH